MYNRCRSGHMLLAGAFHGLLFQQFMKTINVPDDLLLELNNWIDDKDISSPPHALIQLASAYQKHFAGTRNG